MRGDTMDFFLETLDTLVMLFDDKFMNKKFSKYKFYSSLNIAGKTIFNILLLSLIILLVFSIGLFISKL